MPWANMQNDARKMLKHSPDAIKCEQNILNHYHSAMEKSVSFSDDEKKYSKKKTDKHSPSLSMSLIIDSGIRASVQMHSNSNLTKIYAYH